MLDGLEDEPERLPYDPAPPPENILRLCGTAFGMDKTAMTRLVDKQGIEEFLGT